MADRRKSRKRDTSTGRRILQNLAVWWRFTRAMRNFLDDNGEVAFSDFLALAANFGKVDATFADGDFDSDGKVAFADFLLLAANFGAERILA